MYIYTYIYIYIYIYIYSKFIVIGNEWSVAVLETKQILLDLQRCCYVNNLFSPSKFTYPSTT